MPANNILKRCACGREFTAEQWADLPLLGVQPLTAGVFAALRNCPDPCGSTLFGPELSITDHAPELMQLLAESCKPGTFTDQEHERLTIRYMEAIRAATDHS
jgi:hypothetical protein